MTGLPVGPSEAAVGAATVAVAWLGVKHIDARGVAESALTAAWPLIVREAVEACIAVAEEESRLQQGGLATAAASKDVGVMHYCAGEGAERVAARLRALVPPPGEGVA